MKKLTIALFILFTPNIYSFGQNDSLKTSTTIGIRGRCQTGNLKQLALNPNLKIAYSKDKFNIEFQADYQYLDVNDFIVKSDFWSSGIYQYKPNGRVYPMVITRYGFSKSYKINQSLLSGIGAGINIRKKTLTSLIQINAFGGFMNFEYENDNIHSSIASGLLIKFISPISKRLNVLWELNSYHSGIDIQFWGMGNLIMFQYRINKNISLNLTHNITYNNKTIEGVKRSNTLSLFGINYKHNKSL